MNNNQFVKLVSVEPDTLENLKDELQLTHYPTILDWSILSTLERCPRKAKLQYIDRLGFEHDEMSALSTGNLLHKCYQAIHALVAAEAIEKPMGFEKALCLLGTKFPEIEKIVPIYADEFQSVVNKVSQILEILLAKHDNFAELHQLLMHYYQMYCTTQSEALAKNTHLEVGAVMSMPFIDTKYLFAGKCDRIVVDHENKRVNIYDFKTTSRISENSIEQFKTSFQFVGYHYMLSQIFPAYEIFVTIELMAAKKIKSRNIEEHFVIETFQVSKLQVFEWQGWLFNQVHLFNIITNDKRNCVNGEPLAASMNTTSCFDFFKPCEYMTLCHASSDEERQANAEFFGENVWNPLVPN